MSKRKRFLLATVCALCSILTLLMGVFVTTASANTEIEPVSLWKYGNNTTITGNVDVPNYMKSGYSGNAATEYTSEKDLPAYRKNGILVSTKSTAEVVEFKNVIDLNQYNSNTQLIDVVPLVTDRFNAADFRELKITLTDADDETNWFTIHISTNDYQDANEQSEYTMFFLSSSKYSLKPDFGKIRPYIELNAFYGMNNFVDWPTTNATGKPTYFHPSSENIVLPYSIYFDKDTYDISVNNGYGEKIHLFNLADKELVGENNEFKGFTNNRIKLSVSIARMNMTEASYMILNVLGTGMNGTALVDEKEPSYIENLPLYEGELPYAVVGTKYELFDVKFLDFVDGNIESKIYCKTPDGEFEILEGDFIPSQEGIHIIKYVGTDRHENVKERLYYINAVEYENTQPIALTLQETEKDYSVGEEVSIPEYSLTGGSGQLNTTIKVIRLSDDKEIAIKNNAFLVEMAGAYEINYYVNDYNNYFVEKSVYLNASDHHTPVIFGEINIPEKFIDGINTVLPRPNAYDYSSVVGQKMNVEYEITVSGQGASETLSSLVFTPSLSKFGKNITITYKLYCKAYPQNAVTKTYNAIIYKPEYVYEYFTYDEDVLSLSVNTREEKKSYIKFTTLKDEGNTKFKFINPLRAEGFAVQFSVDKGEDNFANVGIKLFDYEDENQCILLTIEKLSETHSIIKYNGQQTLLKGSIGYQSNIELKYVDGYIVDSIGDKLFYVGNKVFSSGKIWAEIYLNGIKDTSSIKVSKLGKQAFLINYRKDKNGNYYMSKFTDTLSPEIELEYNPVTEAQWGTLVNVPYAKAYDAISSDLKVTYSLFAPDNTLLVNEEEIRSDSYFVANQYGVFILKYNVFDDAGMLCEKTFYINVFDLGSPVIYCDANKEVTVKVGSSYDIVQPIVFDAVDNNPTLRIFLINSSYTYKEITNQERVTFDKKGTYIIRYYAHDANYNTAKVDITVYVQ